MAAPGALAPDTARLSSVNRESLRRCHESGERRRTQPYDTALSTAARAPSISTPDSFKTCQAGPSPDRTSPSSMCAVSTLL